MQENPDEYPGQAFFPHVDRVVGATQLDARDVLQAHDLAVGRGAHHYVLVLSDVDEPPLHRHRILHLQPGGRRRDADAAGGRHDVLLLHDAGDVAGGHAKARHLVGIEPDAHAVIARAEEAHEADAGNTRHRILDI